ncbi:MAG: metalloregulator ArsR/SmtB family transcription factor [Rhodothermia bacterium]|nr:MAG: metalloregulator ArsR/SmtB family transcription factor [Rhodothermia bacterium]
MSTSSRLYKDAIYEQFGRIGKALASPLRLELLDLLCQGPRNVETIAREVGHSVANTSHHLHILLRARLLKTENRGVFVWYGLSDNEVCDFFRALRGLAESRLAEIEQVTREYYSARELMEPVDREELLERVDQGQVTVLDVRPFEEFQAGHIAGAISIPISELKQRLAELPRDREIVAYCRGPYCLMSVDAVDVLRANGFYATRLKDGVPDWRAGGYEVVTEGKPS